MRLYSLATNSKSINLFFVRTLSNNASTSVNTVNSVSAPQNQSKVSPILKDEIDRCYRNLDRTFENTKEAFKSKSNFELLRAIVVFKLCSYDFLVQQNQRILAAMRSVLPKVLFTKLLKNTLYGHFVAGANKEEVEPIVARMRQFGVKSILNYTVESDLASEEAKRLGTSNEAVHESDFDKAEKGRDAHADIFLQSIDVSAAAMNDEGIAAIKLTALVDPDLLLKLSDAIIEARNVLKVLTSDDIAHANNFNERNLLSKIQELGVKTDITAIQNWIQTIEFGENGFIDYRGWNNLLNDDVRLGQIFQILNLKTGQLEPLIKNITSTEELEYRNLVRRTKKVIEHAVQKRVMVMIDAEQTYFQPAISRMAVELMRKYNKGHGNVYNTYQAYLKGTLANLDFDMQIARREGWHFGVKLVRGAYIDQERKRAATMGYEDPVNENFEATSRNYERCLIRIADEVDKRGRGTVSAIAASHNENTVKFAVELMKTREYAPSERIFRFAQLYGMCDQLSFPLGQAGYNVYKCIHYGSVDEVLPYLGRRALENGSVLKKAGNERKLLWKEMKRRIAAGQFTYKPAVGLNVQI